MNDGDITTILVISKDEEVSGAAKSCLQNNDEFPCRVLASNCKDLKNAIGQSNDIFNYIDVLILDVDHAKTSLCHEVINNAIEKIGDAPIIVMTPKTEHNLARSLIEYGAAENITREELTNNPERLRDAVEFSLLRYELFKKVQKEIADRQKKADMKLAKIDKEKALAAARKETKSRLQEKDEVIFYMSGGYSVRK